MAPPRLLPVAILMTAVSVAHAGQPLCESQLATERAAHHFVGYSGANLSAAINFLHNPHPNGAAVACPLADMQSSVGNVTVSATNMLAIAGSPDPLKAFSPRLWARFDVNGTLLLTAVTIHDLFVSPSSPNDPQGAAAQVLSGGRLVATGVSFLNLVTTAFGGAVKVDSGGLAEFYGCLFDSCRATNFCGGDFPGAGGAIWFDPGTVGVIADSYLRNNYAGCTGALEIDQSPEPEEPPWDYSGDPTNVTITRTTFANNQAFKGNAIFIWRNGDNQGAVPCPAPGKVCLVGVGTWRCCFDGDYESMNVTLQTSYIPPSPPLQIDMFKNTCASLNTMVTNSHSVGYSGDNLAAAIDFLASSDGAAAAVVCPLADMNSSVGNVTVSEQQILAIAGSMVGSTLPSGKSDAPRLWARFDVAGQLFVTGVTIRDQAIATHSESDPYGAAAQVQTAGRLVAMGVSFLNLVSTAAGGAMKVRGGGTAEFYGCLFDSCRTTNPCFFSVNVDQHRSIDTGKNGGGGAIFFETGAEGVIAGSMLRNSRTSCSGGALLLDSDTRVSERVFQRQASPVALTNVTIVDTTFANNSVDNNTCTDGAHKSCGCYYQPAFPAGFHVCTGCGGDVFIWRDNFKGTVPCPAPGTGCQSGAGGNAGHPSDGADGTVRCCFDGDGTWNLTLPSN